MIILQGFELSIVERSQIESNQESFFYFIFSLGRGYSVYSLGFCYEELSVNP